MIARAVIAQSAASPVGSPRYAILVDGRFDVRSAKTACCLIRYRSREVVVVIDSATAGRTVADVIGFGGDIPIVGTWEEALAFEPDRLLIGVVSPGGQFPADWLAMIEQALLGGLDVLSGMHRFLGDDPRLVAAATTGNAAIHDLRRVPDDLGTPTGARASVAAKVVLAVGSDCNVGKMTVTYELFRAAQARNLRYGFLATGQTGILLHGRGIAVDRVIADFVAGATERYLVTEADGQDLVLVEGQGSLTHPFFSAVTLGLLHGAQPDAMILCHDAGRRHIRHTQIDIPPLSRLVQVYEEAAGWLRSSKVIGVALATHLLDADAAHAAIDRAREDTGLPVEDVVRWPNGALLAACERVRVGD